MAYPDSISSGSSPTIRRISGSNPGALDSTQPARLLRVPGARLSFSAFDPQVATVHGVPDLNKLSLNEELYRPKRIVIETTPAGESFWRFVPSARKAEGVAGEGKWPRVVDICGEPIECTQDQWDLYKLDPSYDCYVQPAPALSTITRAAPKPKPNPPLFSRKRQSHPLSPSPERDFLSPPRKKPHTLESGSEEDEEDEVEEMIVDEGGSRRGRPSAGSSRAEKYKQEKLKHRQERREKFERRAERFAQEQTRFDFSDSFQPENVQSEPSGKRKVNSLFESFRSRDDPDFGYGNNSEYLRNTVNYTPAKNAKRTRTVSPSAAKRDLESKRLEREKQKKTRREQELNARRHERETRFMSEILADVPEMEETSDGNNLDDETIHTAGSNQTADASEDANEEAERRRAIEESRRKLAELERDRPMWEEQARRRREAEKAEEEASAAKAAQRELEEAQRTEAARRARMQQEQEEARQRAEATRRQREEAERRHRERIQREQRWSYGPWTVQRAFERYKVICASFDSEKFTLSNPLTIDAIPWPTLHSPIRFTLEDVEYSAVEKFFADVRLHMSREEYIPFLKQTALRFHPDRWNSKNLFKVIVDETERQCVEAAVITVSQLGPGRAQLRTWATLSLGACFHLFSVLYSGTASWIPASPKSDMSNADATPHESPLRRIRSAGDIPRRPERVHYRQASHVSQLRSDASDVRISGSSSGQDLATSRSPLHSPVTSSSAYPRPAIHMPSFASTQIPVLQGQEPQIQQAHRRHDRSLHRRIMTYFGLGPNASRERKSQVSLCWNLSWGFSQVVVIATLLGLSGTVFQSPTEPNFTEWQACDRPLGIWACLWVVRVVLASGLAYWEYVRDRMTQANRDAETTAGQGVVRSDPFAPRPAPTPTTGRPPLPAVSGTPGDAPDPIILPHTQIYSRLTLLSSLMTLSWFLTAHILEYTSINTCRHSSPHVWWLIFGVLCIMYMMVLEVLLLGFVVLVLAPLVFIFWNLFLICIGRHPIQNPGVIKPEIGKLSKSVVERIPLVMYIPPPPDAPAEKPIITAPEATYSYPPKPPPTPSPSKSRFRFLRKITSIGAKKGDPNSISTNGKDKEKTSEGEAEMWEANWERGDYPFVVLEGNRASCAICLMDFEEPKRTGLAAGELPITKEENSGTNGVEEVPNAAEVAREEQLKLADAGEGAQPLRLLACGHVFHKTCLDPWLIDVSGRCPVCQRAVEIPEVPKKKQRQQNQ
ncbi:hypothetical protein BDQ12DRAFT_717858 [Crucibulum laeve]|uniref:RING-type domain-containing protein n=1 Tax=Crucibulum laeve TaxID=68775 RepID=A0A5C3MH54_9AGAR|nr:hypothetical protein BDQ12DRAFT_717858 [Crucibulum laeve]